MSKEAKRALEEQMGARAPGGLEALKDDELLDLAQAISSARRRQAQALDRAGEQALGRIPRMLRGPIRKVVG